MSGPKHMMPEADAVALLRRLARRGMTFSRAYRQAGLGEERARRLSEDHGIEFPHRSMDDEGSCGPIGKLNIHWYWDGGVRSSPGVDSSICLDALEAVPDDGCMWPIGDVGRPGFRYCGTPRRRGSSYCCTHHAVACGVSSDDDA